MQEQIPFLNMFPDYEPPEELEMALSQAAIVAADINPMTRRVDVVIHAERYIPRRILNIAAREIAAVYGLQNLLITSTHPAHQVQFVEPEELMAMFVAENSMAIGILAGAQWEWDGVGFLVRLRGNGKKTLEECLPRVQQILREQELGQPDAEDSIISLLTLLLIALRREKDRSSNLQLSNSSNNENTIIRSAQQFIAGHVHDKLSVPMVAKGVDVSPSYLTALFHKHLQISPGEYIRRIKLQLSKQMIREGNMNFTEIASALQYSTVHHFSRQFKEKFGLTPTEYARSVR